jgi:hypothetical protein
MRTLLRSATAGSLLLTVACASASISSIVAPESVGHTYHRVLVLAPFGDIGMRRFVEESFEAWSQDSGTKFLPAYRLLFPGRSYTAAEVAQVLRTNGIDATLLLEPESSGTSTTYIPPTYKVTCTQWMSGTGCTQAQSTSSGGTQVSKPWATFSAKLFDANTGAVAWIATGSGGGSAFTDESNVYKAIANSTVRQLGIDHLVLPRAMTAVDSAAAVRAAAGAAENANALTGRQTP